MVSEENKKIYDNIPINLSLVDEIREYVDYLSYEVNPIGPQNDTMAGIMRKGILQDIDNIQNVLNIIKENIS